MSDAEAATPAIDHWVNPEFGKFPDLDEKDLLFGMYKMIRTIKRIVVVMFTLWVISVALFVAALAITFLGRSTSSKLQSLDRRVCESSGGTWDSILEQCDNS